MYCLREDIYLITHVHLYQHSRTIAVAERRSIVPSADSWVDVGLVRCVSVTRGSSQRIFFIHGLTLSVNPLSNLNLNNVDSVCPNCCWNPASLQWWIDSTPYFMNCTTHIWLSDNFMATLHCSFLRDSPQNITIWVPSLSLRRTYSKAWAWGSESVFWNVNARFFVCPGTVEVSINIQKIIRGAM